MRISHHKLDTECVQYAEMAPDVYDGPECDRVRPRWLTEYDKHGLDDAGNEEGIMELNPANFPAGTRVEIHVPICPRCGNETADGAVDGICPAYSSDPESERCGFDWNEWVANEYS